MNRLAQIVVSIVFVVALASVAAAQVGLRNYPPAEKPPTLVPCYPDPPCHPVSTAPKRPYHIVVGLGGAYSNADFSPRPVEAFAAAQYAFYNSKIRPRVLFGYRSQPLDPTLFQDDSKGQLDGYEIFSRAELDVSLPLEVGPFYFFAGGGVDYFKQAFPNEPGGEAAHFHSGLNPIATIGATFHAGPGRHRIAVSRIFQEFKFREFVYYTAKYPGGPLIPLRQSGTLNPAYIEGLLANYEGLFPVNERLRFFVGAEARYVDFTQFPNVKFADSYGQSTAAFIFRAGIAIGSKGY